MFKNRFLLVLSLLSLLLVAMAVALPPASAPTNGAIQRGREAYAARWTGLGEYYQNRAQRYVMDSGTRSYIARGEALEAAGKLGESAVGSITNQENIFGGIDRNLDSATRSYIARGQAMQARNAMDSGTRSYIAWGKALEQAKLNALDSGTRSYIARGEALQAAGRLGVSDACSNTTQENIFARIPNNVDSATRSYIAWGLALQAKNDIGALCR